MNEDKIMDKINKNLKIIDDLLMENGFYKYISKVVNIEDGTSQLYDNLKQTQQENEKYKEVIDKIDKKTNDFIKCCKAEKIESGSDFLHYSYWNMFENFNKQIKEILKEVKE